tara:strand:- start:169 stop:825 length:657 start_codon:yes stop_codon:yes gene_type:complete
MCKVTAFLDDDNFILTSNRDIPEDREHSLPPNEFLYRNKRIVYPEDPQGGGSWIGASTQYIASLLNNKGIKGINKMSRGILIKEVLSNNFFISDLESKSNSFNPYVLILFNIVDRVLFKYTWDGSNFYSEQINKHDLWMSNTIYSEEEITDTYRCFREELNISSNEEEILKFHLDPKNILVDQMKTTSVTQIKYGLKNEVKYFDLINSKDYSYKLSLY